MSVRAKPRFYKPYIWGLLFIAPAAVIFVVFLWLPIVKGMVYSFYAIDFVHGHEFVGFAKLL